MGIWVTLPPLPRLGVVELRALLLLHRPAQRPLGVEEDHGEAVSTTYPLRPYPPEILRSTASVPLALLA